MFYLGDEYLQGTTFTRDMLMRLPIPSAADAGTREKFIELV